MRIRGIGLTDPACTCIGKPMGCSDNENPAFPGHIGPGSSQALVPYTSAAYPGFLAGPRPPAIPLQTGVFMNPS